MQTILVVDDDAETRRVISYILQWHSFNIIEAQDGLEGWQLAIQQKPDLILSDINMPRMNGYELLERLQQDMEAAMIPVIFLSGQADIDTRNYALQLGAADCLRKPFLPDEILGAISSRLL